jgi:leucyl aminopeptidase
MSDPILDAAIAPSAEGAMTVIPVRPAGLAALYDRLGDDRVAYLAATGFAAEPQSMVLLPNRAADPQAGECAVLGLGTDRDPWVFGGLGDLLPAGQIFRLEPGDYDSETAAIGILLGAYRFTRFKPRKRPLARLVPEAASARARAIAAAIAQARDLINTPANHLGPAELADTAEAVAATFGARFERITGAALAGRYPAIEAVGRGSARPPQVAILRWEAPDADAATPLVSLCGKGVCFDTGGYDLKPSTAMLRMKKDMGGAAIMLALARLVMALGLKVRLELRLGCVENSVSGEAMRPGDILATRAGLSVEVGNTDAEGRLVLADLLAEAAAAKPCVLVDAATLTGAARVALGPDLPALFTPDDDLAGELLTAGTAAHDPLWRLPLWRGYAAWLDSPIADLNNVASSPLAGAIIAALFLKRFVPDGIAWAHIDAYAWNDKSRPGRPEGGEAQTARALLQFLEQRISNR